jgi:hypothetical protein
MVMKMKATTARVLTAMIAPPPAIFFSSIQSRNQGPPAIFFSSIQSKGGFYASSLSTGRQKLLEASYLTPTPQH